MKNTVQVLTVLIVTILTGGFAATVAHADDTVQPQSDAAESRTQIAPQKSNTVQGEDVDDVITNNKLRALSGSKSKWSIASTFNYEGGTISEPLSEDRPNISNGSALTDKADLDGSVNLKYAINTKDSILAGIGMRWIAPLKPSGPSNYSGTTFDAMNPTVTYQHVYKYAGVQAVLQASATKITQADSTAQGYDYSYGVDQENMYEIPGTKLSVGASTSVGYNTFNKSGSYTAPDGTFFPSIKTFQSEYQVNFIPILEYQLTEKVNLRTLVTALVFEHYLPQATNTYSQDKMYQSVGVGIAVTRDVFLYPNVQFIPENIRSDVTNVGMSATINVF